MCVDVQVYQESFLLSSLSFLLFFTLQKGNGGKHCWTLEVEGRRRLRKGELLFHTCGPLSNIRQFPRNRVTLPRCFSGKLSNLVLVKRKEKGGG